ncbi:MAG: hypothetical protein GQ468_05335 [Candidatus Scalindua sp.]|nr:hypothetical protein [Candidatus Scalindua sp.]
MALLTGNYGLDIQGTNLAFITKHLNEYEADYWPPFLVEVYIPGADTTLNRNDPVDTVKVNITSVFGHGPTYLEDFYNRIHVTPNPINVGNLLAEDTRIVNIWNAYITQKQNLSVINETDTSGITFIGPFPEPTIFQELEDRDYTLTVTLNGSPIIDATFSIVFPNETIDLKVTGKRVVVFPYRPNWKSPLTERLEWLTDVMIAYDSTEQRRRLRGSPRKSISYDLVSTNQGRQIYDNIMFDSQARNWALPMWVDGNPLTSAITALDTVINLDTTDNGYIVEGFGIIYQDAVVYEIFEVVSLTGSDITVKDPVLVNWPAGTMVYPVRIARLKAKHKTQNRSPSVHESKVNFTVNEHENFFASVESTDTYKAFPVYNKNSNWNQQITTEYSRKLDVLDSLTGLITLDDESERSDTRRPFNRFLSSRAERIAFIKWLYARQGRFNGIWVPSGIDDLTIIDDITPSGVQINVVYTSYSVSVNGRINRRDIRVILKDDSIHYARILSASDNGDNTETLVIETAFGAQIDADQVDIVSFMDFCRMDADRAEIKYHTPEVAESTFVFKSINDDI